MSSKALLITAVFLLPLTVWSQEDKPALTAKELYLQDDDSPPVKPAKKKTQPPKTPVQSGKPAGAQQSGAVLTPVVHHLGLRYNILLVDGAARKAVSTDRLFHANECIQLEFAPNGAGYMYVFLKGTSGKWQVLFPSALMPEEVNNVKARETVRIPANYCFRIEPPSGAEHLFVVLSQNEESIDSLDKAVRGRSQIEAKPQAPTPDRSAIIADNRLDSEIQRMQSELGSKDMSIQKVGEPDRPGEPENAVYVVNASNVSADRVVSEIVIRHD